MITSAWTPIGGTKNNNKITIRITSEVAQISTMLVQFRIPTIIKLPNTPHMLLNAL